MSIRGRLGGLARRPAQKNAGRVGMLNPLACNGPPCSPRGLKAGQGGLAH